MKLILICGAFFVPQTLVSPNHLEVGFFDLKFLLVIHFAVTKCDCRSFQVQMFSKSSSFLRVFKYACYFNNKFRNNTFTAVIVSCFLIIRA